VPGFDAIIDQERSIRVLTSLLTSRSIPHALLFSGIEGVGKRTAATAFAMACNCTGRTVEGGAEACGQCGACRKIATGRHPDVLRVSPSGLQIKIDQIRDLCQSLAMKPYEARVRVAIIAEAHRMNPAAGNALLKMLEEPPDRTVLILTAPQTADLLPTIVSRCQHIRFKPIAPRHLAAMLAAAYGFSPEDATLTAALADGSVTRALAMQRRGWLQRRNWILSEMAELPLRQTSALLALAEKISLAKEDIPEVLDLMATWVRDMAVAGFCPDRIIHQDLKSRITAAARRMDPRSLAHASRAIETARGRIRSNANPRLVLEVLWLSLAAAAQTGADNGHADMVHEARGAAQRGVPLDPTGRTGL
jgi:DNA polymerase III subunit delta'